MQYLKTTLFFVLLVVLSACNQRQRDNFDLSVEDALAVSISAPDLMAASEAMQLIEGAEKEYVLVDVRTPVEYNVGHLEGAVNIPRENFFDNATLKELGSAQKHFILYGNTPVEANGPWMLLRQMGFENISVLAAGYRQVMDGTENAGADLETARFDFLALIEAAKNEDQAEEDVTKPKAAPAPAPRKVVVPQKKKVVVEEEEGC